MLSIVNAASLIPVSRQQGSAPTEPKSSAPKAEIANAPVEASKLTDAVMSTGPAIGAEEASPVQGEQHDQITEDSPLNRYVDEANVRLKNTAIRFSIDEESGLTLISVVDKETGEILRQIPPEEMLHASNNLAELRGLLLDSKG